MSEIMFNLDRIRVDIGNVEGSLGELMKFAQFRGLNDNYEPQEKPRLVGTWTINNWYTTEQLAEAQAAFDGLTIVEDLNYRIDWNELAVQVLDDTKPNYNPAVAIILNNNSIGTLLPEPIVDGQEGRWFMTKAQAQLINLGSNYWFKERTNVSDTLKIVAASTQNYTFNSFNEFRFFTSTTTIGSNTTVYCNFHGCTLLRYLTTNGNIVNFLANSNSSKSNNNQVFYFKESIAPETAMCYVSGNDYTYFFDVRYTNNRYILSGSFDKYLGLTFKERWFNIISNNAIQQQFKTYYEYAAPQLSYDGTNVTMTVERTSTIYYTTDGTTPTVNSTEYTEPFAWDGVGVIKAMAIDTTNIVGDIAYSDDFYAQTTDNPTITYDTTNQTVTISAEQGATIYYTLDGTHPTLESSTYSGPIDVSELGDFVKVRCFARVNGKNDSEVVGKICVMDETLWGTDADTSSFAVQCMDSTKPNYNPAVCIILDNNGVLTDKSYCGGGGYLTKTDAAAITSIGTWFYNKTSITDSNGIVGIVDNNYNFTNFDEFKYFIGITSIPQQYGTNGAFAYCSLLTSIKLPSSLLTIQINYPSGIFDNCSSLEELDLSNVTSIYSPNNQTKYGCKNCTNLKTIIYNNNVTKIFSHYGNLNLELSVLPTNLNQLVYSGFRNCSKITISELPVGITTFGTTDGSIYLGTFANCTSIPYMHMIIETPPNIRYGSGSPYEQFYGTSFMFYVGDGSSAEHDNAILADYLADSNWATYSSRLDTWYNYLHPSE